MDEKPIVFLGRTRKIIDNFPKQAYEKALLELRLLREGEEPDDWKPMSSIGLGVCEIRIHRPFEHRIVYVAKFSDAIYVLHAFEKKTQKTSSRHIQLAKSAYEKIKDIRKRTSI